MKQVKQEKNWYVMFQWGKTEAQKLEAGPRCCWGLLVYPWLAEVLCHAHGTSQPPKLPLYPCPATSLGRGRFPEFQMCLPSRTGVPCGLRNVGTAAAGQGASPGHQHCPELGMQWSSSFCLALLLLTEPCHSVLGCFFKPYNFSPRHRVATHVWSTRGAVAESSIPPGYPELGKKWCQLSIYPALQSEGGLKLQIFLFAKLLQSEFSPWKYWCVHPHLQLHPCPWSPCAQRCGGPFAPLRM